MRFEGLDKFRDAIRKFEDEVAHGLEATIEAEVLAMQQEAADLIPVDTGKGRETLLLPEAIKTEKSPDGPGKRIVFGFITPAMQKAAYYLFWVEFGTKEYQAGTERKAGKKKLTGANWQFVSVRTARDSARFEYRESVGSDGRARLERKLTDPQRWKRVKRFVPARPAQPFWRPAEANLWRRLESKLNMQRLVAAAKRAASLADRSEG